MLGQGRCYQQLDPVLLYYVVWGKIPSTDMGIDRYLSESAGSTREEDEVYRCPPTLLLDVGLGFFAEVNLHKFTFDYEPLTT